MSNRDTDPSASEAPGGVWPPPPSGVPPPGAPASTLLRQRTLTPYAWLDRLIGLIAGAGLAFALCLAVSQLQTVLENLSKPWRVLAFTGIVALLCAGPCLLVRRRFPVLGALMAAGAAVMIFLAGVLLLTWQPS